jgi:hypothetical protein
LKNETLARTSISFSKNTFVIFYFFLMIPNAYPMGTHWVSWEKNLMEICGIALWLGVYTTQKVCRWQRGYGE